MENANNIDWVLLGRAVEFYRGLGFEYVETPWLVDPQVAMVTMPSWGQLDLVNNRALVASGEQGFLQLDRDKKIKAVNYVTCTPCFRLLDEARDELHQGYFMKVELYVRCMYEDESQNAARELVDRASRFMGKELNNHVEVVQTDEGWDLEINGVEVGSYGARFDKDTHDHGIGWWAYGTGLALPRYSLAVDMPEPLHY